MLHEIPSKHGRTGGQTARQPGFHCKRLHDVSQEGAASGKLRQPSEKHEVFRQSAYEYVDRKRQERSMLTGSGEQRTDEWMALRESRLTGEGEGEK